MAFWQGLSYGAQDQPYSYPTNGVTYNGSSKSIKIQDKRENQRKQQLLRQQKQTERLRQLQQKREEERVRQQREREEREERQREERRQWERAQRELRERQENEILARTDPEMLRYYADRSPSIASRLESLGLLPSTPMTSTPSIPMNLEHITDPSLFEDMENTIDCGICMEPCTKDSIGILKCNHNFCVSCIKRQLSVTNNKCAYCRQHIDKITVYNDDSVKK